MAGLCIIFPRLTDRLLVQRIDRLPPLPILSIPFSDPIEWVKKNLVENSMLSADDVKEMEKEIRKQVQDALKKAKAGSQPPLEDLFTDIYADEKGNSAYPPYIRMPDRTQSRTFA